jgi:hypothetical protein
MIRHLWRRQTEALDPFCLVEVFILRYLQELTSLFKLQCFLTHVCKYPCAVKKWFWVGETRKTWKHRRLNVTTKQKGSRPTIWWVLKIVGYKLDIIAPRYISDRVVVFKIVPQKKKKNFFFFFGLRQTTPRGVQGGSKGTPRGVQKKIFFFFFFFFSPTSHAILRLKKKKKKKKKIFFFDPNLGSLGPLWGVWGVGYKSDGILSCEVSFDDTTLVKTSNWGPWPLLFSGSVYSQVSPRTDLAFQVTVLFDPCL